MSWLSENFRQRVPITVDTSTGAAAQSDVQIPIPTQWDAFWDAIDGLGLELRVTYANGHELTNYGIQGGFNPVTRTGVIQIDAFDHPQVVGSMTLAWLYFDTDTAQGDGSNLGAINAPIAGFIDRTKPRGVVETYRRQPPGQTEPERSLQKTVDEEIIAWVGLPALAPTWQPIGGRLLFEEPFYAVADVLNNLGVSQPAMVDLGRGRFVGFRGRVFFGALVQAGTSGQAYTATTNLFTQLPDAGNIVVNRELEARIGLQVQDVLNT